MSEHASDPQEETSAAPSGTAQTLTEVRIKRADDYFKRHLEGQRKWYSDKAGTYKKWGWRLSVVVISAGALIPVVQLFASDPTARWASLVTALLGVVVVVAKGIDRIAKFEETWVGYRKASECMKREYRLYINNAGSYPFIAGEKLVYRAFVERVEEILAEEQNTFWRSRDSGNANGGGAPASGGTAEVSLSKNTEATLSEGKGVDG